MKLFLLPLWEVKEGHMPGINKIILSTGTAHIVLIISLSSFITWLNGHQSFNGFKVLSKHDMIALTKL